MRRDEIIRLWHIAKVAGYLSRFDRMQYVKREFLKTHPNELNGKSLWLEIDRETRDGIPVLLGSSDKPEHKATVLP